MLFNRKVLNLKLKLYSYFMNSQSAIFVVVILNSPSAVPLSEPLFKSVSRDLAMFVVELASS